LPQQKIDDSPYTTRHDDHDQHPEPGRHPAALNIAADISHQQDVAGERRSPGVSHEQPHGQHFVFVMGQNTVKKVLYSAKYSNRQDNSPRGDQTEVILTALRSFHTLISGDCHYAAS
jgi:hypothetical protein